MPGEKLDEKLREPTKSLSKGISRQLLQLAFDIDPRKTDPGPLEKTAGLKPYMESNYEYIRFLAKMNWELVRFSFVRRALDIANKEMQALFKPGQVSSVSQIWDSLGRGDEELVEQMVPPFLDNYFDTWPTSRVLDITQQQNLRETLSEHIVETLLTERAQATEFEDDDVAPRLTDIDQQTIAELEAQRMSSSDQAKIDQARNELEHFQRERDALLKKFL